MNLAAIRAFVSLARREKQQTYIELNEVKEEGAFKTSAGTGGLYPWLKKYGADILEQMPGRRAFRIRPEYYKSMLSQFPEDPAL